MRDILDESVRRFTSIPTAQPRPGQLALAQDIHRAMNGGPSLAGLAPTGVGKSAALLANAFDAACKGQRTWISTESIALQEQIGTKDAPVVAQATAAVRGGEPPTYAVLKGFSNYVCPIKAVSTFNRLAGNAGGRQRQMPKVAQVASLKVDSEAKTLAQVLAWAAALDPDQDAGDVHSCPVTGADEVFGQVSTTPAACLGESECPLSGVCFAVRARTRAGEADIVVGNHSQLAIQAATGAPVVLGNKVLGWFDHVLVDEAHKLPDSVRSQGAVKIGAGPLTSMANRLRSILPPSPVRDSLVSEAAMISRRCSAELEHQLAGRTEPVMIPSDTDPLSVTGGDLQTWCARAAGLLKRHASKAAPQAAVPALALVESLNTLASGVKSMESPIVGSARWIQPGLEGPEAISSPVDVSKMLSQRVWSTREPLNPEQPLPPNLRELIPLGAVAVSGTMPRNFPRQAGLYTALKDYPSPFDAAYGASMLFIPGAQEVPEDVLGMRGLNLDAHAQWSIQLSEQMVQALGGSALVLFSSSKTGRAATEALRRSAAGRYRVHSQWDGRGVRAVVNDWRADASSVLVGTRSLMTGVDGAGDTCRLVILDRIPRAAPNPLDDARTEAEMERLQVGRWQADAHTYVSDAAALLEQSAGRLVRSTSDSGMFALLDPRMHIGSPKAYREATRKQYEHALRRFTRRTNQTSQALKFLSDLGESGVR